MVGAVSKRRWMFRRNRTTRAPLAAVAAGVSLLAALGVLVFVAGNAGSARNGGSNPAGTGSNGESSMRPTRVSAELAAASRRLGREGKAIDRTLRYTPFVANGTRRRREIALTFDDGPSPYTAAIVRILVRMRAQATFFIVGQQLTYFSAGLRDELSHGFDVGDHTENHAWLAHLNARAQFGQIHDAAVGMRRVGAPLPRLFRPPYGAYDARTMTTLRRLKMLMVLWSIDPQDWRRPGAGAIVSNVLLNSRPGAIVLMHDGGGDRSQTIAALPAIIKGLRRRGYALVTVPQLVKDDPPPRHQKLPHLSGR
jgi:peptidoglycan-N-acetylglucosamine deacetylase